jgi:hypothetical protein
MQLLRFSTLSLFLAVFITSMASAQLPVSLTLPQVSPFEERSITIGFTEIKLEYSSVGIKGRDIWDGLVPYGEVWRAGANKNTVFSVSDDVLINGQSLPAGSYGFHTIPGEEEWTIIFSHNADAWGSYFYDESEDALRITVDVQEMDSKYEWMKFSFSEYTDTSLNISLKWAHRSVPFEVTIPREVTFAHIEKQFTTLPAFSWQGWMQGATYTVNNNYRIDKGLEWAERAHSMENNVQTAGLLGKLYILNDNTSEGLEIASELTESWSDNWRAHYSAAEIYETAKDMEKAAQAYENAIELTSNERTKQVLRQRIDALN